MAAKTVPLEPFGRVPSASRSRLFPPKTPEIEANWEAAPSGSSRSNPAFVSVTYGAGGWTRKQPARRWRGWFGKPR